MKTLMMIQALNSYQEQVVEAQKERDNQLAQIKQMEQQSQLAQSRDAVNAKINYEGIFRTIDTIHYKLQSVRIPIPPDPQPTPIPMTDVPQKLQLWRNEVMAKLQDIEDLLNNSGQSASSGKTDFGFDKSKQAGRLRVSIGLPILVIIGSFVFLGGFFDTLISLMIVCIIMAGIRPFVSGFLSALARLIYFLISFGCLSINLLLVLTSLGSSSSRSRSRSGSFSFEMDFSSFALAIFIPTLLIFLVMTWISLQNKLPYPSES